MNRPSLRRRSSLLVAVAAVALGASSCAGGLVGPAPAATVGDEVITRAELDQRVEQFEELVRTFGEAAEEQRQQSEAAGQPSITQAELQAQIDQRLAPYLGTEYTLGAEGAAQQLTVMIGEEIAAMALAEAGGEVTDAQRDEARTRLADDVAADGADIESLPEELVDAFVELDATQLALQQTAPQELRDALDAAAGQYEEQLRQLYDENPNSFRRVCGRLLATDDEASADAALERIEGGESFEDVAAEVSTIDPTAATDAQCYAFDAIAQVFGAETPAEGDLLGPAANEDKWAVLEVDSVEDTPFEEARPNLAQQFPDTFTQEAEAAIADYVSGLLREAADSVTVDPRYGTWDPETLQVVPNPSPTATTTTTTLPVPQTIPAPGP